MKAISKILIGVGTAVAVISQTVYAAADPDANEVRQGPIPLVWVGDELRPGSYGLCEGDCDYDEDCIGDLVCYQRNDWWPVPGCLGAGDEDSDYCRYPDTSWPTSSPSSTSTEESTDLDKTSRSVTHGPTSSSISLELISSPAEQPSQSPALDPGQSPTRKPTKSPSKRTSSSPTLSQSTSPTRQATSSPTEKAPFIVVNGDMFTISETQTQTEFQVLKNDVSNREIEIDILSTNPPTFGFCYIAGNRKQIGYIRDTSFRGVVECAYSACTIPRPDEQRVCSNNAVVEIFVGVTASPTSTPTPYLTEISTDAPSRQPTLVPTINSTNPPTMKPTKAPSTSPTDAPSISQPQVIAIDDSKTIDPDQVSNMMDVLRNDISNRLIHITNITQPGFGTCTIIDDSTALQYTRPNEDISPQQGTVSCAYRTCTEPQYPGEGIMCDDATVDIAVTPPQHGTIVANNEEYILDNSQIVYTIDVLTNDSSNPPGRPLRLDLIVLSANLGQCVIGGNSQDMLYLPPPGGLTSTQTDACVYRLCTDDLPRDEVCATATITIISAAPEPIEPISKLTEGHNTQQLTPHSVGCEDITRKKSCDMLDECKWDLSLGICAHAVLSEIQSLLSLSHLPAQQATDIEIIPVVDDPTDEVDANLMSDDSNAMAMSMPILMLNDMTEGLTRTPTPTQRPVTNSPTKIPNLQETSDSPTGKLVRVGATNQLRTSPNDETKNNKPNIAILASIGVLLGLFACCLCCCFTKY